MMIDLATASIELRHLRYFVAVAQTLHFGRAAERLGITQPVLSDQIRRLETLLGVQLLYRTKRVVQLTEPGRIFLADVLQVLAQTDTAIATVRRAAQGKFGKLVIGYTGPALYTVLPEIVRTFRDRNPNVELTLQENCTPQQEAALLADEIQVGFLHPPIDAPVKLQTVLQEPLIVALPENHPLAARSTLSINDLAYESFILFPRTVGPHLYGQILSLCTQAGFTPKVVQEVTPQPTMVGLVAAGIGIAFVATSMQKISRPGVVYRKLQEETPILQLAMAWKDDQKSPVLDSFLTVVNDWETAEK
ncbi:family transcriptional regulator [Leptolyngbya sp. Heron Island J]|uniref:LysR family transcriptional regulator n=1 Tax=Leptolyngbya sp. Heron Island J TaxID=1385935 RepID=UPI0003B9B517|nr:LysR family transcriptional regulator [Leptolyngbya sp. Heron Island J]ESA35986.1 family transcriptional regulator [Leptolyngbya sp. Heron Island J]